MADTYVYFSFHEILAHIFKLLASDSSKDFSPVFFSFLFFGGGEGEGLPYLICRDARRNSKGLKFPILVTLRVSDRSW